MPGAEFAPAGGVASDDQVIALMVQRRIELDRRAPLLALGGLGLLIEDDDGGGDQIVALQDLAVGLPGASAASQLAGLNLQRFLAGRAHQVDGESGREEPAFTELTLESPCRQARHRGTAEN